MSVGRTLTKIQEVHDETNKVTNPEKVVIIHFNTCYYHRVYVTKC
jgi:hypothetical protein